MNLQLDAVQDSDVANALQSIKDVKHHAAAPPKANKGLKRKHKQADDLQLAKEALREDMHRLLASPYAQSQAKPSALLLDTSAIPPLRALWTLLQDMKSKADAISDRDEAELRAAVQQAVIAIDPGLASFHYEEEEEGEEEMVPKVPSRRSNRLAAQPRKSYYEKLADDELEDLVGDPMEEDEDEDEH